MRPYRLVWLFGSTTLALLGCASAILIASIGPTLLVFCGTAMCVASASATFHLGTATTTPIGRVAVVTRQAVLGGIAMVAFYGYIRLIGISALPLALLVAAGSPTALQLYHQYRGYTGTRSGQSHDPDPHHPPSDAEVRDIVISSQPPPADTESAESAGSAELPGLPPVAAELSDIDLCQAWRRSFVALAEASSPSQRAHIVAARQSYLDELERRHPEGFINWLESGARAASDPSKFVTDDNNEPPPGRRESPP